MITIKCQPDWAIIFVELFDEVSQSLICLAQKFLVDFGLVGKALQRPGSHGP